MKLWYEQMYMEIFRKVPNKFYLRVYMNGLGQRATDLEGKWPASKTISSPRENYSTRKPKEYRSYRSVAWREK